MLIILSCVIAVDGLTIPPYIEAEAKFGSPNIFDISGRLIFSETWDENRHVYVNLNGPIDKINDWYINKFPCFSENKTKYRTFLPTIGSLANKNFSLGGDQIELRRSQGIVGRSLILRDQMNSLCANILWRGPKIVQTRTNLVDSVKNVSATLVIWEPKTGTLVDSEYPNILSLSIKYTDSSLQTTGHQWHIHEKIVSNTGIAKCLEAGALIGFQVSVQCSTSSPEFCSEGDLNAKFGTIDIPGEYVFIDNNLHFFNGEAFVIHSDVHPSQRYVCEFLSNNEIHVKEADTASLIPESEDDDPSKAGMIAGAVIGGFFGLVCIIVLAYCIISNLGKLTPSKSGGNMSMEAKREVVDADQSTQYHQEAQSPSKGANLVDGKWRAVS